jgi:hypothetical protein
LLLSLSLSYVTPRRTPERRTIYFLPFGEFEDSAEHVFDKLVAFARMYVSALW